MNKNHKMSGREKFTTEGLIENMIGREARLQ